MVRGRFRSRPAKSGAEAAGEIALPQGVELCCAVGFRLPSAPGPASRRGDCRCAAAGPAPPRTIPLPAASSASAEEAGAAVAHGEQRLAVHRRLETEAEQVGLALAEEALDADVVADGLARPGQPAMEGDYGVEQAVDGETAGDEVDAEVAGEEKVRLARFHGDAGRDAAAVQVPGAGVDVVLRHHAAVGHGLGSPFERR